jgi:hypothetical protein
MGVIGIGLDSWLRGDRHQVPTYSNGTPAGSLDGRTTTTYLEALAWIAAEDGKPARAVALMGAAETVGRSVGNYVFLFPICLSSTRNATVARGRDPGIRSRPKDRSLGFHDAVTALAQ